VKKLVSASILLSMIPQSMAQVDFSTYAHRSAPKEMKVSTTSIFKMNPALADSKACKEFVRYAQSEMNTSSLIVLKNGSAEIELYANGANSKTKTKVWSISKFLSGLMLGAQVKNKGMGLLDRSIESFGIKRDSRSDDVVNDFSSVKLRNVWNMSSGFNWCEYGNCRAVDAANIMYGNANGDALKYVLDMPLTHEPGSYYRYSAGNYVVLQAALKSMTKSEEEYLNLPHTSVLGPLGVSKEDYAFEVDKKNIIMGGSGLSLTGRAFAKLGQLLLNKGTWGDKELMTPEFFNEMTSNSEAIKNSPFSVQNWEGPAGGSIWLNDDSSNEDGKDRDGIPSFMPNSPRDMIYAGGNFGQFLLVYPSSGLVIARQGGDSGHSKHWVPFSNKALSCFAPETLREDNSSNVAKEAPDTGKTLTLKKIKKEAILQRSRVQELCSCLFVSGYKSVEQCDKMVPTKTRLLAFLNSHNLVAKPKVDFKQKSVTVKNRLSSKRFTSQLNLENPQKGCQLL
jgi:CubicO group peptidase (beta-lactamase class C family)